MVNQNEVPSWLKSSLSPEQVGKLTDLVAKAESQTSGEIVPVLVHRSSSVGHVKWILTGFLTVAFLVGEGLYTHFSWGWHWTWLPIIAFLIILVVSKELAQFDWIQRIFTSQNDEDAQVAQRAELEFYRSNIKKTKAGTGILIFVSWMERRAVILADEGISAHYPEETWEQVIEAMVQEFKKGRTYEAFEVAIQRCGEILKNKLPIQHDDQNELKNHLIIRE